MADDDIKDQKPTDSSAAPEASEPSREDIWNEIDGTVTPPTEETAATDQAAGDKEWEDRAKEPDAEPTPITPEAPAADVETPAPAAEDPWSTVAPELRAERDRLIEAERRASANQAALNRRLNDLQRQQQAAGKPAAEELDKQIAAVKEEFPEVNGPVIEKLAQLEARLTALAVERDNAIARAADAELNRRHPDYRKFSEENWTALSDWVVTQPRHMQEAFARNTDVLTPDIGEVDDILTRFKASQTPPAPKPTPGTTTPVDDKLKRRLETSITPQTRGPSTIAGIPKDGDPVEIWNAIHRSEEAKEQRRSERMRA